MAKHGAKHAAATNPCRQGWAWLGWPFGLLLLACLWSSLAQAEAAGRVSQLAGLLSVERQGGVMILGIGSPLLAGDTLQTGANAYARLKLIDGGDITLRPNTRFQITQFTYRQQQPQADSALFALFKGGLRAVTGLVGKRGDQDSYQLKAQTATIGIRGTHFGLLFCQQDCIGINGADGRPAADGLHADVLEGSIVLSNPAGRQLLHQGEFAFAPALNLPPVLVPPAQAVMAMQSETPKILFGPAAAEEHGPRDNGFECTMD